MSEAQVLVTQAADSSRLAKVLREQNICVREVPTIEIKEPETWCEVDSILRHLSTYEWIVFTSRNTVSMVSKRLAGICGSRIGPRVAAVGKGTAGFLRDAGWNVDYVPTEYNGATLARDLSRYTDLSGRRVLFPKGDIARSDLPDGLRSVGADVTEVIVYRTVPAEIDAATVKVDLQSGLIRIATFTSPSTAQYFALGLGVDSLADILPPSVRVISIGPTTSSALRDLGRAPDREAIEATVEALADAVIDESKGLLP